MPPPLLVTFVAGASGTWRIDQLTTVIGDGLPAAERLAVLEGSEAPAPREAGWVLRGVTSNTRYTNRSEVDALVAGEQGLSSASDASGAYSHSQDGGVVGFGSRRAPCHLRGTVSPYRRRLGISAGRRQALAPQSGTWRAIRLPHVVRICTGT